MAGGLNNDNDHAVDGATAYEGQKTPPAARRSGRSGWSLVIAVLFLLGIAAAFLIWPESRTDPAPGAAQNTGTTAAPTTSSAQ